jgi:hypothetical protein
MTRKRSKLHNPLVVAALLAAAGSPSAAFVVAPTVVATLRDRFE